MASEFDLSNNPFAILEVSPRASAEALGDAKADRLFDSEHNESAIEAAHADLVLERKRLLHELSWLTDIAPARAKDLVGKLRALSADEAFSTFADASQLSRANLAAHFLAHFPLDRRFAAELIDAHNQMDWGLVRQNIDENRTLSGFGPTRDQAWKQAEVHLLDLHASVLLPAITEAVDGPEWLASIISANDRNSAAYRGLLERTISKFDRWSAPFLDRFSEGIDGSIARLKSDTEKPDQELAKLEGLLKDWDRYCQPAQLRDQAKGLDEPRSIALFYKLRAVAIWFANERDDPNVAQRITLSFADLFAELPTVAAMTATDLETLSENIEAANVGKLLNPLSQLVDEAIEKRAVTARQVLLGHFAAGNPSLVGSLFVAFEHSVENAHSLPDPSRPWFMVRTVALALNNDHNDPRAAKSLVESLILNAPPDARARLDEDLNSLRSTILEEQFGTALKSGDLKGARALVVDLIDASPAERAKLEVVRNNLDTQLRSRTLKRVGWSIFAGVIAIVIINEKGSNPAPSLPTPDYSYDAQSGDPSQNDTSELPAPTAFENNAVIPTGNEEEAPQPYSFVPLTVPQLRFCRFESARIEQLQRQVSGSSIAPFNAKVDYYNSRCGNFKYQPADLATIDAEVAMSGDRIKREATETLTQWASSSSEPSTSLSLQPSAPTASVVPSDPSAGIAAGEARYSAIYGNEGVADEN